MSVVLRSPGNNSLGNDYVSDVRVLELEKALKDLFISEWILEEMVECDEDWSLLIVEAFDRTFVSVVSSTSDTPDVAFINKDGGVFVASQGFASIDLYAGTYYAGDEVDQIGKNEPYESDASWLWNSRDNISSVTTFSIGKETYNKIMESRNDK